VPEKASGLEVNEEQEYDLEILSDALHEIVDQADYYVRESGDDLAARWDRAVEETVLSLLTMPHRGSPCVLIAPRLKGMRRISVRGFDAFSVFYYASRDPRLVTVIAVLHMSRDIARILSTPRV
jgi:plasmid stabilization system protein ParE